MSKPTIVITNWVQDEVLERLHRDFTVVANRGDVPWPEETLSKNLEEADGVITFMPDKIDASVLQKAPKLKIVSCCLKGHDNFSVADCTARGVLISVLPDLLTEPGAELAIGMMIAGGRHMMTSDAYIRRGEFKGWRPKFYGLGLAESTVGLLGFGAVGRSIAERLRAFRSNVIYWDKRRLSAAAESDLGVSYREFDQLLRDADYVVLALSLTPETRHIINAESLAQMKKSAVLVNFARGSLVDEAAVANALNRKSLGFFAADTFEFEDWALPNRPLEVHSGLIAERDRTLFTPHLGSAVIRVREEMAMQAAENIIEYFAGQIPSGALNGSAVSVLAAHARTTAVA